MSNRTYKVVRSLNSQHTYRGFNRDFSEPHDLVLAFVDGEAEIWAIDDSNGFESLLRYYQAEVDGKVEILARYSWEGFRGVICPPHLVHHQANALCDKQTTWDRVKNSPTAK